MSESDSSIPQKVAALAEALEAVCQNIGFGSELELSFYAYLRPMDSDAWLGDEYLEYLEVAHQRNKVLAAAAKFVEAVDTAERLLNAIPVSALEPLSSFTGGVRWDLGTRRTLKELQAIICNLRKPSTNLDVLFSKHGIFGKARFEEMQSNLTRFVGELRARILDLQSLPNVPTKPTGAISSQWNGDVQGGPSNANTEVIHPTEQAEADRRSLEEIERKTPKLDTQSIEWIAARKENKEKLGYPTSTLATYRLESSGGRQLSPYFGIDKDGRRWRRRTDKTQTSTVYYFADDIEKYKSKVSN